MNQQWIALCAGSLGLAIISATVVFVHSLWFLWALLPANATLRFALDRTQPSQLEPAVPQYVPLAHDLEPLTKHSSRFAYALTPHEQVLVVLPALNAQISLPQSLAQAGWQVERLGLIIRAQRGQKEDHQPSFTAAVQPALADSLRWQRPLRPLALLESQGVTAIARRTHREITITVQPAGTIFPERATTSQAAPDAIALVVPGSILKQLPRSLVLAWNSLLRQKFGFIKTKPDIMEELSDYSTVLLGVQGKTVTVGVADAQAITTFASTVQRWSEDEDRYNRPVKRAFRLPDGSLGYELVPGPSRLVFQPDSVAAACLEPIAGRATVTLCHHDNRLVVATAREQAQLGLQPAAWTPGATIGQHWLTTLPGVSLIRFLP